MYRAASNSTYGRSSGRLRMPARLMFLLQGYWSESSGKGCFVGYAPWYSSEGEPFNLEAMFMINYSKSSTYSNSFVTGKLESLSHFDDEGYFKPISILSFPQINRYEYKLISEETVKGIYLFDDIEKSLALGSQPGKLCSLFSRSYITLNLEYASSCSGSLKKCYPLDGVTKIQKQEICYGNKNKIHSIATVQLRC
ncbi:hypothetical protein POM88_050000 [Heracleum sosnowskyi]|uniref:DUF2921 domain-containing protein n=1 Tax=Heracleum sosnowskyi TaxID=360622 RepID=A0AAD8GYW3_9APIA|nr:hypothetical protein POM88_050000 [Heracleum sosnowskyi]